MTRRFVWLVGAIQEQCPDAPAPAQDGSLQLWDRQERKLVTTVYPAYAQAICLEGAEPGEEPFSHLADWLNGLSNEELNAEGIVPNHNTYNISDEVYGEAEKYTALDRIATGGGLDYVVRYLGDGRCMTLSDPDDAGSPDKLTDQGYVVLWLDKEWSSHIAFRIGTVVDALRFMGTLESAEFNEQTLSVDEAEYAIAHAAKTIAACREPGDLDKASDYTTVQASAGKHGLKAEQATLVSRILLNALTKSIGRA